MRCTSETRPPHFCARNLAAGSAASARSDPSSGTSRRLNMALTSYGKDNEIRVEREYGGRDRGQYRGGGPTVDQRPHQLRARREQQERHQGERQAETEHHLTDDKRAGRVEPRRDDRERRRHRNEPPHPHRYFSPHKPLHDNLARGRAYGG